jgi:hypothetical protein
MKKIQLTSQVLRILFRIFCWSVPLITAYLILFKLETLLNWGFWSSVIPLKQIHSSHYSLMHRFIILAIQLLPISITVIVCNKLAKLFSLYGKGILFEEENINLIKGISIFMIVGELIQFIYQPLMSAALSFNNPPGERFASILMGTTNISTLVIAIIILVASWILEEAQQLKSDSQLTI